MRPRLHLTPMALDNETPRLPGPGKHYQLHIGGLVGTLSGFVVAAVGLILAVTFSLVLFALLLGAGVLFGGYFWWKTRNLRRQLREEQLRARAPREREVEPPRELRRLLGVSYAAMGNSESCA